MGWSGVRTYWWIWLTVAILGGALIVAGVYYPGISVVVVGALVVVAIAKDVPSLALLLLLAGPLLGSQFTAGPLTVDNWLVLGGIVMSSVRALSSGKIPFSPLSVFPLSIAFAIAISGVANGVEFLPAVIRYVGIACIPWLLDSTAGVSRLRGERIVVSLVLLGALSVLSQPIVPLLPPYIDPDTNVARFGGLFGHPNFAACVMGATVLYLIATKPHSRLASFIAAMLGLSIVITASLGAIISLAVGLIVLFARKPSRILGLGLLGGGSLLVVGSSLIERVNFLSNAGSDNNSLTWRIDRWKSALNISEQPSLLGIGWEQVEAQIGGPAHSGFIAIYVELGIAGAALLVLALTRFARVSMTQVARESRIAPSLLVFVLTASVTDPILIYPSTLAIWIALSALAIRDDSNQHNSSSLPLRTPRVADVVRGD
jgi:O-antigen ligase